jgi:hypothetical protein
MIYFFIAVFDIHEALEKSFCHKLEMSIEKIWQQAT